jgi:hypothetical protein
MVGGGGGGGGGGAGPCSNFLSSNHDTHEVQNIHISYTNR